jgi:hypothetical protein
MFHWICPECGQEIAPGVKECPVCDPQTAAAPASSNGPLATVMSPRETAPLHEAAPLHVEAPPPAKAPEPQVILQPEIVQPPILKAEKIVEPERVIEPKILEPEILQPEIILANAEIVLPEAEAPVVPAAAAESPLPEAETFSDRLADLAQRLHGSRMPYGSPRIIENTSAPRHVTERTPKILDVTPAQPLLAAPPTMRLLAEPQPPSIAVQLPTHQVFKPQPASPGTPARAVSSKPAEAKAAAPNPVQLPQQPGRSAAPALAKLQSYFEAADRLMGLAASEANPVTTTNEPRITLPGPALPRELLSLQAAGLVPIGVTGRRAGWSGSNIWTGRLAVTAILVTAGLAASYRIMPGSAASTPVAPIVTTTSEQPAKRPDNSHSLARFLEVSGVRFVELNKKPEIQYLVVNHSSAPLSSLTVYVTLRSSNSKQGQAPLARFMFHSPNLAAYEAKEMANPIEHVIGPLDLPDWQDLRADVEVQ